MASSLYRPGKDVQYVAECFQHQPSCLLARTESPRVRVAACHPARACVAFAVRIRAVDLVGETAWHGRGDALGVEDPGLFIPRGPEPSVKTGVLRSAFFKGKGTARSDLLGPVVTCGRYRFVCQSKC